MNISSVRKRCAEYLREFRRTVNTGMPRDADLYQTDLLGVYHGQDR